MKTFLAIALCTMTAASPLFAQTPVNWTTSLNTTRFIENKSQFNGRNELSGAPVLFAIDNGSTQIYFTSTGMTFRLEKAKERKSEHDHEKQHAVQKSEHIVELVHMKWENANANATVTGVQITPDYFSYTIGTKGAEKNINHIKGYEKILYHNLYPNIDVEYSFHPDGGVKYTLLLHAGADVSQVKMNYSKTVLLDAQGNLHLATAYGDIIDHAPLTFYQENNKIIPSQFTLSGNTVSFKLGNFNTRKEVILDPWTVTPSMPDTNKVYNIKTDLQGNAYIYGGDDVFRLQKYNAAGALQWTYNSTWNSGSAWFGTLAVDTLGNSFITSGSEAAISRINSGGGLVWNTPGGFANEFWTLAFSCDYSQLMAGGTSLGFPGTNFKGVVFNLNLATGQIIDTAAVARTTQDTLFPIPNPNEVRTMCSSPNGNYYFLTLDTMGSLSQVLSINYRKPSSHRLRYSLPYGQGPSQGINGICATSNMLYTTDGQNLIRRDINNGNFLNAVTIPAGLKEFNSGIAVDSCGNVYVGAIGKVHKYDANLNLLASINVPAEVYDLAISSTGEVLACGAGFALSANMSSCGRVPAKCAPCSASINGNDITYTQLPSSYSVGGTGSFNWSVTNGIILSGQGTNTIQVYWQLPGQGTVRVTTGSCGLISKNITLINRRRIIGAARTFPPISFPWH